MSMRKQLVTTIEQTLETDESLILLLGDIGVYGFRNGFAKFPTRVYNIGILEQTTIGMAAGLAITGFIPVVHTIAPFIAERALEQLKIDFGFQQLGGNFISVGGSYDYAALGATHHAPGDVGTLMNIPGMEIVVPGTAREFDKLFRQSYRDGQPTYYRLSEQENSQDYDVSFGHALCVKNGNDAIVIAVGPVLDLVLDAVGDFDVTVLYYTTLAPFDSQLLREHLNSGKILVVEPFYEGTLTHLITSSLSPKPITLTSVGVPRTFITHYGKKEEHDRMLGFTVEYVRTRLEQLIYE